MAGIKIVPRMPIDRNGKARETPERIWCDEEATAVTKFSNIKKIISSTKDDPMWKQAVIGMEPALRMADCLNGLVLYRKYGERTE